MTTSKATKDPSNQSEDLIVELPSLNVEVLSTSEHGAVLAVYKDGERAIPMNMIKGDEITISYTANVSELIESQRTEAKKELLDELEQKVDDNEFGFDDTSDISRWIANKRVADKRADLSLRLDQTNETLPKGGD